MSDPISKPTHYTHSAVEPIDAIEAWRLGFHLGNVVKYIARADHKGSRLSDLKKARWYLDREIERAEQSTLSIVDEPAKPESIAAAVIKFAHDGEAG